MGEVAHQHLPPQVQDFIHHVPKSVEQIPLILLREQETVGRDGERKNEWRSTGSQSKAMNEREIDKEERQNEDDR